MRLAPSAWPVRISSCAALTNQSRIADLCRFSLDDLRYQYPSEAMIEGESPQETLARLVQSALPRRYPAGTPETVRDQIRHELTLIERLGYAPYFLTVNTIVQHARSLGIACQGRGSAANSAICYVLRITSIDPVRSGLLFERFISEDRKEPPDIDVDFESDRREEIIQWIYSHYGRHRAALCATVQRFQPKGALREVGKVLGLPDDVTGQLSRHIAFCLDDPQICRERLIEVGLNPKDRRLALTLHMARQLLGFPRQLDTHPGGFVLTQDRLDGLVPLQPAAMEGRQIITQDERLLLTRPEGVKAHIGSALEIGENRNEMIRGPIRKRTRRLARAPSETAPEDDQTED